MPRRFISTCGQVCACVAVRETQTQLLLSRERRRHPTRSGGRYPAGSQAALQPPLVSALPTTGSALWLQLPSVAPQRAQPALARPQKNQNEHCRGQHPCLDIIAIEVNVENDSAEILVHGAATTEHTKWREPGLLSAL